MKRFLTNTNDRTVLKRVIGEDADDPTTLQSTSSNVNQSNELEKFKKKITCLMENFMK